MREAALEVEGTAFVWRRGLAGLPTSARKRPGRRSPPRADAKACKDRFCRRENPLGFLLEPFGVDDKLVADDLLAVRAMAPATGRLVRLCAVVRGLETTGAGGAGSARQVLAFPVGCRVRRRRSATARFRRGRPLVCRAQSPSFCVKTEPHPTASWNYSISVYYRGMREKESAPVSESNGRWTALSKLFAKWHQRAKFVMSDHPNLQADPPFPPDDGSDDPVFDPDRNLPGAVFMIPNSHWGFEVV